MKKNQFTFTINRDTHLVVSINGNELKNQENFFSFFEQFLSKEFFCIYDEKYNPERILEFIKNGKTNDRIRFQSNEKSNYSFAVLEENGDFLTIGVHREAESRVDIDFLTGVKSRSYLFSYIQEKRNEGGNQNSYLLRIDLDNFKAINDTYGHIVGDRCLQTRAEKLQAIFQNEIFGRYGGDEFLCLLSDCSKEKLEDYIKKVLQVRFQYEKNALSKRFVTCSVGCSLPINDRSNVYAVIQEADNALYQAKNKGKNRGNIYLSDAYVNEPEKSFFIKKWKREKIRSSSLLRDEIRHKKTKYLSLFCSFIVLFAVIIMLFDFSFRGKSNSQAMKIAETLAEEQSTDISKETTSRINLSFASLESGKFRLDNVNYTGNKRRYIADCLSVLDKSGSVLSPGILLSNGDVYYSNGKIFNISNSSLCNTLILKETKAVDVVSFLSEGDKIVLGYPCNIQKGSDEESVHIKGVLSIFRTERFSELIFGDFLSGKAYLSLLKSNGNRICASSPQDFHYFDGYHNLVNRFDDDGDGDYYSLFSSSLKSKDSSIHYFELKRKDSEDYQAYYFYFASPALQEGNLSDWRILIAIPYNLVLNYFSGLKKYSRRSVNILFGVFIFVFFLFFIYTARIKRKNFKRTYTDPITNTINESRFIIDATSLLSTPHSNYYIVYLNIQKFKYLNNRRGSREAEKVLVEIARIRETKLKDDELISRQFADRFRVMVKAENDQQCYGRIKYILDYLTSSCTLVKDSPLHLNAGIYHFAKKNEPIWFAVSRAKKVCTEIQADETKNNIEFFNRTRLASNELEIYIEQSQESALSLGKFLVYYQGKYDLKKNRITSCEALVRWKDDRKGFINTQTFINIFEKNGFILKLDLYIFECVLKDIKQRIRAKQEVLPVSINLSRRHFENENFFDEYEKKIHQYNIPGKYLEFEITESIVLSNQHNLNETIDKIHSLGCKVSIDDFGSGFSNLSMLNRTNYDILKMDRNLLSGKNGFDDYSKNILKMVVSLNKSLGKKVVCESVEHKEESDYLRAIGCDLIQGYYYAKPLPKNEFCKLVLTYENKKTRN